MDGLTVLTGTESKPDAKKQALDASLQVQILNEMAQSHLTLDEQQHEFVTTLQYFLQNTVFTNRSIPSVVGNAFQMIKNLLGKDSTLGNFLLQELLFRLQDESQQVKKFSAQKLKELIDENYDYIGLVFTDILQMQNQDQFMVQVFDEYVLLPISNGENVNELCKFFESCPVKLFESIFASFLKDRQVDFEIISQLLKNNRIGSYVIMYYIVNYSQPFEKADIVEMVKQLHSTLLQNMEDREL